jgi:hypothetical protein
VVFNTLLVLKAKIQTVVLKAQSQSGGFEGTKLHSLVVLRHKATLVVLKAQIQTGGFEGTKPLWWF